MRGTVICQGDASVAEACVCAALLAEDLLQCVAALKHPHLPLLLQHHLQPLLRAQDLLRQGVLQFLGHKAGDNMAEKHLGPYLTGNK